MIKGRLAIAAVVIAGLASPAFAHGMKSHKHSKHYSSHSSMTTTGANTKSGATSGANMGAQSSSGANASGSGNMGAGTSGSGGAGTSGSAR